MPTTPFNDPLKKLYCILKKWMEKLETWRCEVNIICFTSWDQWCSPSFLGLLYCMTIKHMGVGQDLSPMGPQIFPQQRKLGVFSHSKGSGAGRSSQIRWEPGSGEGSGEEFPFTGESLGAARSARRKVGNRVPSKRFPSKVPRNMFPSNGS